MRFLQNTILFTHDRICNSFGSNSKLFNVHIKASELPVRAVKLHYNSLLAEWILGLGCGRIVVMATKFISKQVVYINTPQCHMSISSPSLSHCLLLHKTTSSESKWTELEKKSLRIYVVKRQADSVSTQGAMDFRHLYKDAWDEYHR